MLRRLSDNYLEVKDWRRGFKTQTEVMSHILSSEVFANALLVVGREKVGIKVIKEIVQSLSPEFEVRLTGEGTKEVGGGCLPAFYFQDVDEESMRRLLHFAYTHEWTCREGIQDLSKLFKFLQLTEKLGIWTLTQKVRLAVENLVELNSGFMNEENVCQIFELGNSYGVDGVRDAALDIILKSAPIVFSRLENYKILSSKGFAQILQRDELRIESELEVFNIVLRWGKEQRSLLKMKESVKSLREVLKDCLPQIRFLLMSQLELLTHVQSTEILDVKKMMEILTAKVTGKKNSSRKRNCSQLSPELEFISLTEFENILNTKFQIDSHKTDPRLTLIYKTEKFDESTEEELLTLVLHPNSKSKKFLLLYIKFLPNCQSLLNFLAHPKLPHYLHITLKVGMVSDTNGSHNFEYKSSYPHLRALSWESMDENSQNLSCLMNIIQNSPNLRQLSVGSFSYVIHFGNSFNLVALLESGLVKNVQLSCSLFKEIPKWTLVKLKENGVTLQRVNFNQQNTQNLDSVLDLFHDTIEEIHNCYNNKAKINWRWQLDKLKLCDLSCDAKVLFTAIEMMPSLEELRWIPRCISMGPGLPELTENGGIVIRNLKRLTLIWTFEDLLNIPTQLFENCGQLEELAVVNCYNGSMRPIYELFGPGQIISLRIIVRKLAVESVAGLAKFKDLRSLSFGYEDYQHVTLTSSWALDEKILTDAIRHLTKLELLTFPPMTLAKAEALMTFLEFLKLPNLKLVRVNVWLGSKTGHQGTMTQDQMDSLTNKFTTTLTIEAHPILLPDARTNFF